MKFTATLGVTPSSYFENDVPNFQILSVRYKALDGEGDLVYVTVQKGVVVNTIMLTTQEAVKLGFINPEGLDEFLKSL